jgi:hypothetical protein
MKFLIKKIVSRSGKVHFKRWRLLSTPWFNVYVHGIYQKDLEADMHDHPWDFTSIVLYGGYVEQTEKDFIERRFLHIKKNKAEDVHRIYRLFKNTYTLVITGRRRRDWGYKTKNGWVEHQTYRFRKHVGKI